MSHEWDSGWLFRQPAWHGLGDVSNEDVTTWARGRVLGGCGWDPVEEQQIRPELVGVGDDGVPVYDTVEIDGKTYYAAKPVDDWKYIVRSDTGAILYSARDTYGMITNTDMGLVIDEVLKDVKFHFDTVLCLDGGRKVVALIELGEPIQINGDPSATRRYMAVMNSHDGQTAFKVISTNVRIVCANTWHAADLDAKAADTAYVFYHSGDWKRNFDKRAEEIRLAIRGVHQQIEEYREVAEEMSRLTVSNDQVARFFEEVIYPTKTEHELGKIALRNVQEARVKVRDMYISPTCEGIRGNAYGLLQVGGEYWEHGRTFQNQETHIGRSLLRSDKMKQRARTLAYAASEGRL